MKRRLFTILSLASLLLFIAVIALWAQSRAGVYCIFVGHRQYTVAHWGSGLRLTAAELTWPPPTSAAALAVRNSHHLLTVPCWIAALLSSLLPSYWCWRILIRTHASRRIADELGLSINSSPVAPLPNLPWSLGILLSILWLTGLGLAVALAFIGTGIPEIQEDAGVMFGLSLALFLPTLLITGIWIRRNRRLPAGLSIASNSDFRAAPERRPESGIAAPGHAVAVVGNSQMIRPPCPARPSPAYMPRWAQWLLAHLLASYAFVGVLRIAEGPPSDSLAAVVSAPILPLIGLAALIRGAMEPHRGINHAHSLAPAMAVYLMTVSLIAAALRLLATRLTRRARRLAAGLCPTCAYDLRATSDRCPECGTPVPQGHVPTVVQEEVRRRPQ